MDQDDAPPGGTASSGDLERLVVEALDLLEREGVEALERHLAARPDQAPAVRAHLERIHRLGLLGEAPAASEVPERLGDFRILETLGQGGMGVVFRAVQESLGREVALKLIRPDQLWFPGARERFQREIELVARVQHPGIVPIHAVGRQDGLPYFAMEFVRGATLADLILELQGRDPRGLTGADLERLLAERFPGEDTSGESAALFRGPWVSVVLRILQRVAEALAHAHGRGVLHRDVKPSNVMLDRAGRVLLLDFGLASGGGDQRLTRTGSQLGSLAYMAPELLAGTELDFGARCDVYSLGATAWELLTLRLPYQSSDPVRLRELVAAAARPRLSELNPAVSWDVETVVATALEPDPARRYAGAAQLARDLGNVLAHRPIEARRAGPWLRLRRWTRRRPALATALALGALLLAAGPLGWELNRARTQRATQAAFERSERDFQTSLQAIGHVLRDTALEELEDVPRAQRARLTAIDNALALYADLERGREDAPEVLTEGGELHKARGDVLRDLGRTAEAEAEFLLAVDRHRRALALDPAPARTGYLSAALAALGKVRAAAGRPTESLPLYREALALTRARAPGSSAEFSERVGEAKLLLYAVEAQRLLAEDGGAEPLAEALALATALRSERPDSADAAWLLGRAGDEGAWLETRAGRLQEALDCARRALAGYADAHALAPRARFYAFDVATGRQTLADCLIALGRQGEADAELEAGLSIVGELLRDFPDSERYRSFELKLLETRATSLGRRGRHAEARPLFARCAEESERLLAAEPASCERALRCARALLNLGTTRILAHDGIAQGLAELDRAEQLLEVCAGTPDGDGTRAALRDGLEYNRGLGLCFLDRPAEALPVIERRAARVPPEPFELRMSADLWNEYWLALRRAGSDSGEEAQGGAEQDARARLLGDLRRAIEAGYDDLRELDTTPALDLVRRDPEFRALRDLAARAPR